MRDRTRSLWAEQDKHLGDRWRLFTAVAGSCEASKVLYPGSYVDLAPSFVWPSVTYVDVDRRANRFFDDLEGVRELIAEHDTPFAHPEFRFIHADYTDDLGLPAESFDLLISLYAGFISEACGRYLRPGGVLLVNPSHGDAAMASIDERFELVGVVLSDRGDYRVTAEGLDTYMVPKKDLEITPEYLHELGRGIAYTKPAFAYLFRRTG